MLTGNSPSDCLLIEAVHWGHPEAGYYRGLPDVVVAQGLQLLTLLSYATTVQMAYELLLSGSEDQITSYLDFNSSFADFL